MPNKYGSIFCETIISNSDSKWSYFFRGMELQCFFSFIRNLKIRKMSIPLRATRISLTKLTKGYIVSLCVGKSLRKVMPRYLLIRYILRGQRSSDINLNQIKPFQNSTSPAIRYCLSFKPQTDSASKARNWVAEEIGANWYNKVADTKWLSLYCTKMK